MREAVKIQAHPINCSWLNVQLLLFCDKRKSPFSLRVESALGSYMDYNFITSLYGNLVQEKMHFFNANDQVGNYSHIILPKASALFTYRQHTMLRVCQPYNVDDRLFSRHLCGLSVVSVNFQFVIAKVRINVYFSL